MDTHDMDMPAASAATLYDVPTLPSDDVRTDELVMENTLLQHSACDSPSCCSTIHSGFSSTDFSVESNSCWLSNDLQSDSVESSWYRGTSCYLNAVRTSNMATYAASVPPESMWLLSDNISYSYTAPAVTAVANCTRPLFECDDDDDSSVDRLVIDIKDEDAESTTDELYYTASSIENSFYDEFNKCSFPPPESVSFDDLKPDVSEALLTGSCDENSELHNERLQEKPCIDTSKVEIELCTKAAAAAKLPYVLNDEMFMRWPAVCSRIGAGLQNLGNTCFVNATIQCLTYTVPLVNCLLTGNHSASCEFIYFD